MHICLPDTREVKPQHGSAYLLYNLHIDGLYHCSLRYKQLLHLHQALVKKFTTNQLPSFPPKRLLPLSANQVEERRHQLEKYLQNISQDKAISNSSIFNLFLLEAQRESTRIRQDQAHLDIELVNGQKIRLQVLTHDSADAILTAVCRALGLNDRYHAYFCLCLCGYDVIRDKLIIKRRLSFFESPYVTLQMAIQQQEQLQNLMTAAAATATSNNQCSCCCYATTNTNSQQQQLTAAVAGDPATNSSCQCPSCSNSHQQSSNNPITNDVPLVGSSSGSTGNHNINNNDDNGVGHYNNIDNQGNNSINNDYQPQYHASNRTFYYPQQHHQNQINPTTSTSSFVTHRILLRKSYWDPIYDTYILNDQQALNLLFIQTVYDIKHSLMFVDRETYHRLESLLAADSKLEYILLARTLKYYNHVHFEPCLSDYPRPRTKVMISIGSKELNMRVLKAPKSITRSSTSSTTLRTTGSVGAVAKPLLAPPGSSSSASTSASSSPSSSSAASSIASSSDALSTSSTSSNSNTNHATTVTSTNQQVKETSDQILYCTSSMVPSGYRHLITKDDLVEEEYNFKVPLIRCWRLTSLETLNSKPANNVNINNNISNEFPTSGAHASNARRKTLSLFNSLSISSSGSNNINNNNNNNNSNNNNNTNNSPADGRAIREQFTKQGISHSNGHQNGIRGTHIGSGTGGSSLLAALVGSANGFHRLSLPQNSGSGQHTNGGCPAASHRCPSGGVQPFSQYELSFEYLISKDTLRWITISSDQAIFISISLQGVVDELVSKRDGNSSLYQSQTNQSIEPAASSRQLLHAAARHTPNNANNHHQQSFTYLYREGRQKALDTNNQQLIDKFGTTLGYSPMNPTVLALARQRQQSLRASSSSHLSTGSRFTFLGSSASDSTTSGNYQQQRQQQQRNSSLEISHLKKAPSPILNDAFEGLTNDDDL